MTGPRADARPAGTTGYRGRFLVLFVSTGNVCRSPIAERVLDHRLAVALGTASTGFSCESAGTWGHEGARMEPFAAQLLAEHGARSGGFSARELTAHQIAMADLVLGATREHSEQVVALDPFAMRRTFTIGEFARLADGVDRGALPAHDPVTRARVLVGRVADRRKLGPVQAEDIDDPYGAPLRSFRLCAAAITDGLSVLVESLASTAQLGQVSRSVT